MSPSNFLHTGVSVHPRLCYSRERLCSAHWNCTVARARKTCPSFRKCFRPDLPMQCGSPCQSNLGGGRREHMTTTRTDQLQSSVGMLPFLLPCPRPRFQLPFPGAKTPSRYRPLVPGQNPLVPCVNPPSPHLLFRDTDTLLRRGRDRISGARRRNWLVLSSCLAPSPSGDVAQS